MEESLSLPCFSNQPPCPTGSSRHYPQLTAAGALAARLLVGRRRAQRGVHCQPPHLVACRVEGVQMYGERRETRQRKAGGCLKRAAQAGACLIVRNKSHPATHPPSAAPRTPSPTHPWAAWA